MKGTSSALLIAGRVEADQQANSVMGVVPDQLSPTPCLDNPYRGRAAPTAGRHLSRLHRPAFSIAVYFAAHGSRSVNGERAIPAKFSSLGSVQLFGCTIGGISSGFNVLELAEKRNAWAVAAHVTIELRRHLMDGGIGGCVVAQEMFAAGQRKSQDVGVSHGVCRKSG